MLIGMPEAGRRLGLTSDSARRALQNAKVPLVHINARTVAVEDGDLEIFKEHRQSQRGKGRPSTKPPVDLSAYSQRNDYDKCRWRQVAPELEPPEQPGKWQFSYIDGEDAWQFNEVKLLRVKGEDAPTQGRYYVGRFDWPFDEYGVCYWYAPDTTASTPTETITV